MRSGGPPEEAWRRAGTIAARARDLGCRLAGPGVPRREIAEKVEAFIRSEGAEPAFPANLSINEQAAHFTPPKAFQDRLKAGDMLKVDVGAHIDGAIADTAATVEVGSAKRYVTLIQAVEDAVEAGIREVRANVSVDTIARVIETAIHSRGFKPIRDLSGHTIEPYLLHAGKSIPNVGGMSNERLQEGEHVAIEPFATNGVGRIENGEFGHILRFRGDPGPRAPELAPIFRRFSTLPFTLRWVDGVDERTFVSRARRYLQTYPIFVEAGRGIVAQAEHTLRVTGEGAEVLTRG